MWSHLSILGSISCDSEVLLRNMLPVPFMLSVFLQQFHRHLWSTFVYVCIQGERYRPNFICFPSIICWKRLSPPPKQTQCMIVTTLQFWRLYLWIYFKILFYWFMWWLIIGCLLDTLGKRKLILKNCFYQTSLWASMVYFHGWLLRLWCGMAQASVNSAILGMVNLGPTGICTWKVALQDRGKK